MNSLRDWMISESAASTSAQLPMQKRRSSSWRVKARSKGLEKRSTSHLYTGVRKKIMLPVFSSMLEYRKESYSLRSAATTSRSVFTPSRL